MIRDEDKFMVSLPSTRGKRASRGFPSAVALCLLVIATLGTSGCGTIASLNGPLIDGRPLVMSGTRFDLAALRSREHAEQRFGTPPPTYPLLDLPFSVTLDVFALGFTLPTAAVLKLVDGPRR